MIIEAEYVSAVKKSQHEKSVKALTEIRMSICTVAVDIGSE